MQAVGEEIPYVASKNIELGIANFQVASIDKGGKYSVASDIVIRATGQKNNIQSYGLSGEGGLILMPLPPGRYCYDAFTETGEALRMEREPSKRCFYLQKDSVKIIGVGFLPK